MVAEKILTNLGDSSSATPVSSVSGQSPNRPKRKRTWVGFVRDLCVYLLVYFVVAGIAIGPLFWTWYGSVHADGPKWIASLYLPLAFLCEICPPIRWLINEWINWWIL